MGNDGGFKGRAEHVIALIPDMSYFITGHPAHPLYLKGNLKPRKFST